uniref:EOG090X0CJ3 n=1 Tax=Moina brachiata TaxID=675436 RepID=A0A4Y7NLW4_9CRUS|nr:EOG090X0CJ3 [Moina brachiata]SVE93235.1 EOG090X0CJ3 [Moina brachiata]
MLLDLAPEDRQLSRMPSPYASNCTPYEMSHFPREIRELCKSSCTSAGLKISKAIVLGNVSVGKSCLVNRFCQKVFDQNYKATIGVDFEVERFDILQVPFNLQIWDTAGQERFKCIASSYYRDAHAVIVVFDMTDLYSLTSCPAWLEDALKVNNVRPIVFLVGTKRDLLGQPTGDRDPLETTSEQPKLSMLSWGYYQRYFDVDTEQVKERLMWSFLPRPSKDTLTHFIRPSPDLYGPFWVCVTLVFCIAIMGNISDYLQSGGEGQHWRYDFRKVSISATSIFIYALLVPFFLWGFLWWRKPEGSQSPLALTEIVSLYGYSLAIYIPISVLWTIPLPFIQWSLVIVGAALSGSVIVLSLWKPLSTHQRGIAVALLAILVALHFLLAAGLQLYFFRYAKDAAIHSDVERSATTQLIEPSNPADKVTELKPLSLVLEDKLSTNFYSEPDATSPNVTVTDNDVKGKTDSHVETTLSIKTDLTDHLINTSTPRLKVSNDV